ncbi:outer membrane protein assembly factor BamC [Neisseria sp.]|uniref:outer membrane protein assembly factor BamC n=1 Tax=Neisseria sp. TaxID=192066 RepID=UPI0035A01EF5
MTRIKPVVLAVTVAGLAACSSSKDQPKFDYQSQNRKVVNLEVPPDLSNPNQGNLYALPAGSGAVRASDMKRGVQQPANQSVLQSIRGVRMERDGSQRWIVVEGKQPAEIWPLLKAFWQENGFSIASEEPGIGQMETDWAENRAKIKGDGLRRMFEKVGLGGIYSTSERDKFTIRIEQGRNGSTEVFFAHKGMQEVYADKNKDTTRWQPRANDPSLEAAFLGRFMQYLGVDAQQAQQAAAGVSPARAGGDLARIEGGSLLVSGDHARNWRRAALALERTGLTVVGQNAQRHAFLVQPAPQEGDAVANKKPGLFSRWFGKGKKAQAAAQNAERPQLIVAVEPVNGGSRVSIFNKDGSRYNGSDASTLLGRLHAELR